MKVPGYFNAWAAKYSWHERAAVVGFQELQAARKQTLEQAEELQGIIQTELEALQNQIERERAIPGDPVDKSATLAAAGVGAERRVCGPSDGSGRSFNIQR